LAVRWQPNNSLTLTRRAGRSGLLESPASLHHDALKERNSMKNALVVGGAGFLGAALASELKNRGVNVRTFDRVAHPDPAIPTQLGDLRDKAQVKTACEGVEAVFQTAALVDWGPRTAGIYGPGDRHRLPSILKAARSGQNIRLGDGSAKFGHVYVANVVHAHVHQRRFDKREHPSYLLCRYQMGRNVWKIVCSVGVTAWPCEFPNRWPMKSA
jgi:hypothetical protein